MQNDRRSRMVIGRAEAGVSLVELMVAVVILLIAIVGLIATLLSSMALREVTRETAIASEAARMKIEEMRDTAFDNIFTTYNATDDFAVNGLLLQDSDVDGFAGKIVFPVGADPDFLDESFSDPDLGMPRDLNGNDDTADQMDTGYFLLPVKIRIEWQGKAGNRIFELNALLSEE